MSIPNVGEVKELEAYNDGDADDDDDANGDVVGTDDDDDENGASEGVDSDEEVEEEVDGKTLAVVESLPGSDTCLPPMLTVVALSA